MANQRTPIDMLMDGVEWTQCPPPEQTGDGIPYATHTGQLKFGECVLDVVVLNNGMRIITEDSLERYLGGGLR